MADIHTLPVQRKRGRRRTNPKPGVPSAQVLNFDARVETAEQQVARMYEESRTMAYHLLMAVRSFRRAFPSEA
jgi:hypothetical protein